MVKNNKLKIVFYSESSEILAGKFVISKRGLQDFYTYTLEARREFEW